MWLRNLLLLCWVVGSSIASEKTLAADPDSRWIRPLSGSDSQPVWGIKGGIAVGLWPTPGPRGLIRVYTPYLDQPAKRMLQFIAVEPIVAGRRDLSELQKSQSDGKPGKQMWTSNTVELDRPPGPSTAPATGVVSTEAGVESLSFYIIVEGFDNGARPIVKISLRSDRPHEITLQTFAAVDSKTMDSCVLTATMGNYARLRNVYLKNSAVNSEDLFKLETRDGWQFFPWHQWPAGKLPIESGTITFAATGEIESAVPDDVPPSWRYAGIPGRQYWRTEMVPGLMARVNGRSTFWGTQVNIPGGAAYENFELKSPFSNGQLFYFGVDPLKENR